MCCIFLSGAVVANTTTKDKLEKERVYSSSCIIAHHSGMSGQELQEYLEEGTLEDTACRLT